MRRRALVVLVCACGPLGPREVVGPGGSVPPPLPGHIVAAERYTPGSHLVYLDERGQRVADLTEPPGGASLDFGPTFSPDGRWVAFASSRGRSAPHKTSLWIVRADRSQPPQRLTDDAGVDVTPAFSPDGRRIAFASDRGGSGLDLWLIDVDDGHAGAPRRLTSDPAAEVGPAWSHRGDVIAYNVAAADGGTAIFLVGADGRGARRLTDGADATFSPDDRTVVFVARGDGAKDADLHAIDVDGGNRRLIIRDDLADEQHPCFSRDGRFLFASAVLRRDDGSAMFSAVVALELAAPEPRLLALIDRLPAARLGVAVAPAALDEEALRKNPTLYDAMLRVLLR